MDNFTNDNNFLARWISGELTPEELEKFKRSKDYPVLNKINDASQKLQAPEFNAKGILDKLDQGNLNSEKSKTKLFRLASIWPYAAIIILAFGLFYMFTMKSSYSTDFGEQLAITLPDNSTVRLNAKSSLKHKILYWKSNRIIYLKGEAFFDVEKGEAFKVVSDEGEVEVLGTEFNVISRNDYFEVRCNEGKVRVTSNELKKEVVLLPGKAVRVANNDFEAWSFALDESTWMSGESTFTNTPIFEVLKTLENQYNIKFDTSNIDTHKRFTGAFINNDLKLALKTVSTPMNLTFYYNKRTNLIVLKQN